MKITIDTDYDGKINDGDLSILSDLLFNQKRRIKDAIWKSKYANIVSKFNKSKGVGNQVSEQTTFSGKLKEIKFDKNLKFKDKISYLVINEYFLQDIDYENEKFNSDDVILIDEIVYEIIERNELSNDDYFLANKNEDGTILFNVSYYNGGCSFDEAIEQAIKDIEN